MFDFISSFLGKSAKPTKDGHDMSNNEAMSLPFATHVPLTHYPVVPNEHYKFNINGYVQTANMREDNFATIYQNLHAVFVPLSSIQRDYSSLTTIDRSTRKDAFVPDGCNFLFDLDKLFIFTNCIYFVSQLFQSFESIPHWRDFLSFIDNGVCKWRFRASSDDDYIYLTDYGLKYLMFQNCTDCTQFRSGCTLGELVDSFGETFRSLSGHLICNDIVRILDNLGYCNLLPLLESTAYYLNNNGTYTIKFIQASGNDKVTFSMDANNFVGETVTNFGNVSLLEFIAYQYAVNTCFRSNYRNPFTLLITCDYLNDVLTSSRLVTWNFTRTGSTLAFLAAGTGYKSITSERFNSAKNDLYELFVNGQDLSIAQMPSTALILYLFGLSNPLLTPDVFTTSQLSVVSGNIPSIDNQASFNSNPIQEINNLEALYSLRQDLLRAGVKRDKQMQAIFGVSGRQHVYEDIQVLDKSQTRLNIQGIINQAASEVMQLGERGARGNGSASLDFEFNSDEFGYLFIIGDFTCETYYESFMIDRHHTLSPQSWFNPKFNHLGLEAIRRRALSVYTNTFGVPKVLDQSSIDSVVGFSSRNWELKQRVNKVHGLFTNYGMPTDDDVMSELSQDQKILPSLYRGNSIFGGFVPTLITQQTHGYADYLDLYYSPYMLNNIFMQMVDGNQHDDQSFDYFRCVYHFGCHKVSPMPKIGLMKLNV